MTAASTIAAKAPSTPIAAPTTPFGVHKAGFARVDVFVSLADARRDWVELEAIAHSSPYQGFAFAEAWFATIGDARKATPFIVVARDAANAPLALLPLARFRHGPLGIVEFLGGKDANCNMGLFRPGPAWSAHALEALFVEAARAARARVDLFALFNQPSDWESFKNPLALLAGRSSPSAGYKSELPLSFEAWRDGRYSKVSQKKLRKKAERLASMGPLEYVVARDEAQAVRMLDAYIAQKRARADADGFAGAHDSAAAQAFLRRLASRNLAKGRATMEMHALMLGDRAVATFGALPGRDRLSGLVVAYDSERDIARCSPGELLVHEVVSSAIARGFAVFDLGVGGARYKSECCEGVDVLFDTFVAINALGQAAAFGFGIQRRLKAHVKRSPRLLAALGRLRNSLRRSSARPSP